MTELNDSSDLDSENEHYPIEPGYHPVNRMARKIYDFLASSRLAMFLLVTILACCVVGVTVIRGERASELIFNTLWFNGILVLLVLNVACCFFGRIWGRKVTLVSFGMILFHLSFVAMFAGIIYNSLFYFDGIIRLTEGETLRSGDPQSYDSVRHGRFFDYAWLKGHTKLVSVLPNYKVGTAEKRVAYEITVGEGRRTKKGVIFVTNHLDFNGFRYYNDKEGYSTLVILYDKNGNELYGAYLPLQSVKQKDDSFLYATGTIAGPGSYPFPQNLLKPEFNLQMVYSPDKSKDRAGEVLFRVWPLEANDEHRGAKPLAEGKAAVGARFDTGQYILSVKEIRYWVGMSVRFDPGKPIVLASLCVGLGGMIITTIGRLLRRRSGRSSV